MLIVFYPFYVKGLPFSQLWFATVQEVLQADWQEVWHSPHPPFFKLSFNVDPFKILICFICFPL